MDIVEGPFHSAYPDGARRMEDGADDATVCGGDGCNAEDGSGSGEWERAATDHKGHSVPRLEDVLPDAENLLSLEPEELGGYLLEYLNSLSERERDTLHRNNFLGLERFQGYPAQHHESIRRALMEAWVWLEREGFLAPKPGSQGDWQFITRRGRKLIGHVDVEALRRANLLPRAQLHPEIADAVSAEFLRGRYDSAIFNALREVEVAVRKVGGFTAAEYGDDLMRKAFNKDTGPLTDRSASEAERNALSHLFAGAFGRYRGDPFKVQN
jgi:uncharacterized protein (TIGR02391 family)